MDTFLSQSDTRSESVSQPFNWSNSQEVLNIFTLIFLNMIDSNNKLDNIYHGLPSLASVQIILVLADSRQVSCLQMKYFSRRNFNSMNSQVGQDKPLRITITPSPQSQKEHDISQSRRIYQEQTTTRNVPDHWLDHLDIEGLRLRMCDEDRGEDEITIDEQIFLHHIDQLKREKRRDIGRIAGVLLQIHVFIREKFHKLQVKYTVFIEIFL